jgi:hypothetical protein
VISLHGSADRINITIKYIYNIMHLGKPKLAQDLGLCTACSKNNYSFLLSVGNLCSQCFVRRYGEIILLTDSAEYYGGYNTYEVGRFRKHQSGPLHFA